MALSDEKVREAVAPIMRAFDIRYAGLFGSVARGDSHENSDVDLLVDIGHPMGMIAYMKFVGELEAALRTQVDLVPLKNIQPILKDEIKNDLITIYEKG